MNYSDLIIYIFEMIGTVAFASSGALVGIRKNMDIFGVNVLGITTAVGGRMHPRYHPRHHTPENVSEFQLCRGFHPDLMHPVHHLLSESGTALKPLS